MAKFPADAPLRKVISTLEQLGFRLVREENHIAMLRENPDGTRTPLTIPNHPECNRGRSSYLHNLPYPTYRK